jgi:hypothetical protein
MIIPRSLRIGEVAIDFERRGEEFAALMESP